MDVEGTVAVEGAHEPRRLADRFGQHLGPRTVDDMAGDRVAIMEGAVQQLAEADLRGPRAVGAGAPGP
jgi:hypothetical protein